MSLALPVRVHKRYQGVLVVLLLLAIAGFTWHALSLLYDGRYSVTRQDFWRIYLADLRLPLPVNALQKHNSHPVFFPSLLWLTVLHGFGNDQTFLFLVGLALTLATLGLLCWSLWRAQSLGIVERLAISLLYAVATLWVGKANIIASGGFSCMNSLACIGFIVSFVCLHGLTEPAGRNRAWLIAGVSVAAFVASFSFGTGLVAWAVCAAMAALRRLSWKNVVIFCLGGVASAVVIMLLPNDAVDPLAAKGLRQLLLSLPQTVVRFVQLIGAPWFYYGRGWIFPLQDNAATYTTAGLIGLLGLLVAGKFILDHIRLPRPCELAETVALGMMMGMLGSLLLVALGRGALLNPDPHEVLAPRYYFWSAFFWSTLPVQVLYRWPRTRAWPGALTVIALFFAAAAIPSQRTAGRAYSTGRQLTEAAAMRLVCGVENQQDLQNLFRGDHSEASVYSLASLYRRLNLDMFAWSGAKYVGGWINWVERELPPYPHSALGHWRVTEVFPLGRKSAVGARFTGWCVTRDLHQPGEYVLISQGNGRIVGLGKFTFVEAKKNQKYGLAADRLTGFEGYIQNYASRTRYVCRVVTDGQLVPGELRQAKARF
jgi:hypothetical protein